MFPQKRQFTTQADSKTYPLGEKEQPSDERALALIALSHTHLEHRIYTSMLAETSGQVSRVAFFSTRQLMALAGIRSSSTLRRGLDGLIAKLSIERQGNGNGDPGRRYLVHNPDEVLARRAANGVELYPHQVSVRAGNQNFERAIKRVVANDHLSRREVQVALCCVEGLTNSEIGARLKVSEQTVKFHLRHIYVKFRVKRRAELISRLLL